MQLFKSDRGSKIDVALPGDFQAAPRQQCGSVGHSAVSRNETQVIVDDPLAI